MLLCDLVVRSYVDTLESSNSLFDVVSGGVDGRMAQYIHIPYVGRYGGWIFYIIVRILSYLFMMND